MLIRAATSEDWAAIWAIIEPIIRAGETYALDPAMTEAEARAYWLGLDRETFVAEDGGAVLGTYYLRANQPGGGGHVANCGYATAEAARGKGVARAMCEHSLMHAKARGFTAMQFNFVVASNEAAVSVEGDGLRCRGHLARRLPASAPGPGRCAGDVSNALDVWPIPRPASTLPSQTASEEHP